MLRQVISRVPFLAGIFICYWSALVTTVSAHADTVGVEVVSGVIDGRGMMEIFSGLEGSWQGSGEVTIDPGTQNEVRQIISSSMRFTQPSAHKSLWSWDEELQSAPGRATFFKQMVFRVIGDQLFLGVEDPPYPTVLIKGNPREIYFTIEWKNPPNRNYRRKLRLVWPENDLLQMTESLYLHGILLETKQINYTRR